MATITPTEYIALLHEIQDRYEIADDEMMSVLAGILISMCRKHDISPHDYIGGFLAEAAAMAAKQSEQSAQAAPAGVSPLRAFLAQVGRQLNAALHDKETGKPALAYVVAFFHPDHATECGYVSNVSRVEGIIALQVLLTEMKKPAATSAP